MLVKHVISKIKISILKKKLNVDKIIWVFTIKESAKMASAAFLKMLYNGEAKHCTGKCPSMNNEDESGHQ